MRTFSLVLASTCLCMTCVGLPPPPPASEASSGTTDPGLGSTTTSGANTLETQGGITTDTTVTTTASETTMGADPTTVGNESSSGPSPACPGDCDSNELCEDGRCVEACGGAWGTGSYDYCLTEYGAIATDEICGPDHICVYWPDRTDQIGQAACARQGCVDACDCPPPAATGNANVTCGDIASPMEVTDCYLSCENGETCPDGMSCTSNGVCMTDAPEVPVYGDCGNLEPDCAAPGFCVDVPGGESVCTVSCDNVADCAEAFPPGGTATPACSDIVPGTTGFECYLDCVGGPACPDGMACINGTLCMWPD
jgi:hypothetical protein